MATLTTELTLAEVKTMREALKGFISTEENCAGAVDPRFVLLDIKLGAHLVANGEDVE